MEFIPLCYKQLTEIYNLTCQLLVCCQHASRCESVTTVFITIDRLTQLVCATQA